MTILQEQARALGDPTRYTIFRYVAEADAMVNVAELTAHLGLNHNAIRQHLAKLLDAGLVEEAKAPSEGRGRPRLVYRVHPAADSRWGVMGPYERLSLLLSEILRTGDSPREVGRRFVHRSRLGNSPGTPLERMTEAIARQGFDPTIVQRGSRVEMVLRTCPFETAALSDPDTVCGMHLGIAEGLAEVTGGQVMVDKLIPHDPRRANCRLRVHLVDPTSESVVERS